MSKKPALDQSTKAAVAALNAALGFSGQARRDYIEMLGCAAIHYMRATEGDEFTRGWIEHALSDLDKPPLLKLPTQQ